METAYLRCQQKTSPSSLPKTKSLSEISEIVCKDMDNLFSKAHGDILDFMRELNGKAKQEGTSLKEIECRLCWETDKDHALLLIAIKRDGVMPAYF